MEFLTGIFTSVPILVVTGSIVIVILTILILTKTAFKIGKVSITPGGIEPTVKKEHNTCELYPEHKRFLLDAFEDGIKYKELESPIYKRLRQIVTYKANNILNEYAYEGYHQVFHDINGRGINLKDTRDHLLISDVIEKLRVHMMDEVWGIIEDNHIVQKNLEGTWQSYRSSRIQESLENVQYYMITKVEQLEYITDREKVKMWYERNSHLFISRAIEFWDNEVVVILTELYNNQKKIRGQYV